MRSDLARIAIIFLCCDVTRVPSTRAEVPQSNSVKRLPITEGKDRVFVPTLPGTEMSHATVGQIVDDEHGFLWFATRGGVLRYDGYQVRVYSPNADPADDSPSFDACCRNNAMNAGMVRYSLFRDRSGKIWVGDDGALHQYDPVTDQIRQLPLGPEDLRGFVRNTNQDSTGKMWLSTSRGLVRYDPSNGQRIRFPHLDKDETTLSANQVRATFESKDGTFWVATSVTVDILDRQTGHVVKHFSLRNPLQDSPNTGNPYVRFLEDSFGTIWIASARDGLAFVDRLHTKLIFLSLTTGPAPEPGVWAILEDRSRELWVGTEQGLLKLDRDRRLLVRYHKDPADPKTLASDWVLSLFEDREDGIWVGTAGAGVARFSEFSLQFQRYATSLKSGRTESEYIYTAYEDNDGTVWAGSRGAVYRIDLTTGHYRVYQIPENTEVRAIAEDRTGQFWFGTADGSMFRFNPSSAKWTTFRHGTTNSSGCANNEVQALHVDRSGTLWVGSGDSLCAFDTTTQRFHVYKSTHASLNQIEAIADDSIGRLWIGSRYSGLHRFDPTTGEFADFQHTSTAGSLSSDIVMSVLVDRSGSVWAGTADGLNRLDEPTGKFTVYRERDGLANNIISGVAQDDKDDLWITTASGISRFHIPANTLTSYYQSDGVPVDLTGVWMGHSGRMFFGSYHGLNVLTSETIPEKAPIPRVVLTSLQILDKSVAVGEGSPLKQSVSIAKDLTLPHNQNTLSFEFAALAYPDPERIRYRYRLTGLEREWNEVPSTERFVRYSVIAPGNYTFEVQARTSRGSWSQNGPELHVRILPPFWATWEFRALCALLILAALWCAHNYQLQHLSRELKLRFEERIGERTRVARELHDTLLQGFMSASMQLNVAADYISADSAAKPLLDRTGQIMRQVIQEGRNSIAGLRSADNCNLEDALTRIPGEVDSQRKVAFQIVVEGRPLRLRPLIRDEVYSIGREALMNAFRHSAATALEVEVEYATRHLRLLIRDNGCGIDPLILRSGRTGHWGLAGMRERAKRMNARINIWSRHAAGTEIELLVPGSAAFDIPSAVIHPWREWLAKITPGRTKPETGAQ